MKTNFIKTVGKIALILVPAITLSMNASAHDPKMHAKKAEKADCSKMDHSKMDMKDPVAVAMMKKCMKQAEKSKNKKIRASSDTIERCAQTYNFVHSLTGFVVGVFYNKKVFGIGTFFIFSRDLIVMRFFYKFNLFTTDISSNL